MKTNKHKAFLSLMGCFLFFLTALSVAFFSILTYETMSKKTTNTFVILFVTFLIILFFAITFSIIDLIRRKYFVEKPTNEILEATKKVSSGDLTVRLNYNHKFDKFDEYDEIKRNLNDMIEELSKQEILKNDFISNVSHEIKTPLSIIQNYASILSRNNLDEKTRAEYLNTITHATKRLNNLIINILKLNKLENQVYVPANTITNASEILSESILTFSEQISSKSINLNCDIDDIKLKIDENFLEIIFNNLLSNAVKFTNANGEIFVSFKTEENFIVLTVKDSGCGMNTATGNHIFDKFYQGDTSHSSEGNGLGLALVKRVIDTIGGSISVSSTENVGSTFTVKLKKFD